MKDLLFIQEIEQASALMQPVRIQLLKLMAIPSTCAELGNQVAQSPQRVYYHIKKLEEAGLAVVRVRYWNWLLFPPGSTCFESKQRRASIPGRCLRSKIYF